MSVKHQPSENRLDDLAAATQALEAFRFPDLSPAVAAQLALLRETTGPSRLAEMLATPGVLAATRPDRIPRRRLKRS